MWALDSTGNPQLMDGGLNYGHLQMDLTKNECGSELLLTPVYLFPMLDTEYNLVGTERRIYNDVVMLHLDSNGLVMANLRCGTIFGAVVFLGIL